MIATTDPLVACARFGAAVDELTVAASELRACLVVRRSFPVGERQTEEERFAALLGIIVETAKGLKRRADRIAKEA